MCLLVSIIVPAYNQAHYLPYALKSVLSQFLTQWEAIVVDDGSTDDTAAVVAGFADRRVRYIHQENQGLAGARNTGIRAARGRYLAFLDADDEWEPAFLHHCVRVLEEDGAVSAVYTLNRHIDGNGNLLPLPGGTAVSGENLEDRLLEGGFFPPCAVVARADIVRRVGMFDVDLPGQGTEDWDLWLRIAKHDQIKCIPKALARYRVCPESMSTDAGSMQACRMAVLPKHVGAPEGEPDTWPEDKRRAYAFAYRSGALGYMQQGKSERARQLMEQAVLVWPPLLERLDTVYELACGDQPKGFRGKARLLDIEGNGARILDWLDGFLCGADDEVRSRRAAAYGNAYLALAMLSDQAGRWRRARSYLLRAVHSRPGLLRDGKVVRRLLKLWAGKRLVGLLRTLQGQSMWPETERD